MSKSVVWWWVALGAVVVLPLLAGAGPAGAVSAKKLSPARASACDNGCSFQVTAFKAEMTVRWSWSVSNQANNSGWASQDGAATFTETMKPHPLVHNGQRGDGALLVVRGKVIAGTVAAPRVDTYDTHRVDKTAQHPPETCTNHGKEGIGGSSLEFKPAGPASGTVAIHWELGMQETGQSESCMPTLASLVGVDRVKKLFTTMVHVGELKVPVVHLRGQGSAPVSLGRSDTQPGATGFKSGGSVHWQATITLKRLPQQFGS